MTTVAEQRAADATAWGEPYAWPLPPDGGGASLARSVVSGICARLRLPLSVVYDAQLATSELVANATRHAPGAPAELWTHLPILPSAGRHPDAPTTCGPAVELAIAVFDGGPPLPAGRAASEADAPGAQYAECGRGLAVVASLAAEHGGTWGSHPARARLTTHPGKAVYYTFLL